MLFLEEDRMEEAQKNALEICPGFSTEMTSRRQLTLLDPSGLLRDGGEKAQRQHLRHWESGRWHRADLFI